MDNLKMTNVIIRKKLQLKKNIINNTDNIIVRKNIDIPALSKIKLKLKENPIDKLNKYLDMNFHHNLMYLKDSWSDVNYKYQIDCHGKEDWWDLEMLIMHFTEQLNASTMSGPSPQWPSNPFNRQPYNIKQLLELGKHISKLEIPINIILKELLIYIKTIKNILLLTSKFSVEFIKYIENRYRYQLLNNKDSQGNYIGHWVEKNVSLSLFEIRYKELQQITPSEYDSDDDTFIETDEYIFYMDLLNYIPKEFCDYSRDNLEILVI